MKYGESLFDILYILLTLLLGIKILINNKTNISKLMGCSVLVLGIGDSFHLIPRVLNYFIDYDFNIYLGVGKLITSITMTIFYILIYYVYLNNYKVKKNKKLTSIILILSIIRILVCLFPQNEWLKNESVFNWGIYRNIPFVILGFIIALLYFNKRLLDNDFKNIWIYITLSFIFYIVVVLGSSKIPLLGMFMLPKTICYILIILSFYKKDKKTD